MNTDKTDGYEPMLTAVFWLLVATLVLSLLSGTTVSCVMSMETHSAELGANDDMGARE